MRYVRKEMVLLLGFLFYLASGLIVIQDWLLETHAETLCDGDVTYTFQANGTGDAVNYPGTEMGADKKILAVGSGYQLKVTADETRLLANGNSSTIISAKLTDKNGKLLTEEDVELVFSCTLGNLGSERVTMQEGVGQTTIRTEYSTSTRQAVISAMVVESRTNPDLPGLKGSTKVIFYAESDVKNTIQKITYQSAAIQKGKVTYGKTFSLNAKSSGKGTLSYKSSNSKVLSVNAKGKVSVKQYGSATITIWASAGQGYKEAKKTIKLTVMPRKVKITTAQWKKGNKAYFKWVSDLTVDGYQYSFAYNPQFSSDVRGKSVRKKNSLTMSNFNMSNQGIYIRVRAYKKIGKVTTYGEWSDFQHLEL